MDQAFLDYLVEFHCHRDYFECHEILEERWKADPKGERQLYWVALIQIAVGLYHFRRRNFSGAEKMLARALEKVKREKAALTALGIRVDELVSLLEYELNRLIAGGLYEKIELPLTGGVRRAFNLYCEAEGFNPASENLTDYFLVNKHLLRERNELV